MQRKPKYEKIMNTVRQRIRDGVYPPEQVIPDQNTLAKEFGVSRMTIKQALDGLQMEGLIYSRRGDGTYVLGDIPQRLELNSPADLHPGLTAELGEKSVTTKVIKFDIIKPTDLLQKKLLIPDNAPLFDIIRLRQVDGHPYVLEHTYMPHQLIPGLNDDVLAHSIYKYLKDTVDLKQGGAYRVIHADKAQEYDIKYLDCKPDDPVLEVEQIAWLKDGTRFEYSLSRNRFDVRSYTVLDINPN